MYIDPLDSSKLLRKIDDRHVIDGFGNRFELIPREPRDGPGWPLVIVWLLAGALFI